MRSDWKWKHSVDFNRMALDIYFVPLVCLWVKKCTSEHSILGDAVPVIMISPQAVNLNKSSEINGQWLHFSFCVCTRTCRCHIFYIFVCSQNLQQHTNVPPHVCLNSPVCCSQWTWFTTHTPHSQLLDGIIKVRLHRLWPLKKKKHMDVFHPPKGR